jgi:hypothetical protein
VPGGPRAGGAAKCKGGERDEEGLEVGFHNRSLVLR